MATGARCDGEMGFDMDAVVIEEGSEAFEYLRRAMALPELYKISLDPRGGGVAIKANEFGWTPTLDVKAKGGRA